MIQPHIPHWVYKRLRKEEKQIDGVTLIVGLMGPIATLPQIYKIFAGHSAANISILSWSFYLLATLISLTYSVVHRLKPLFWSNICWVGVEVAIIYGIYHYK